MVTDIFMTLRYFESSETYSFAYATAACVSLNLGFQSLCTVIVNKNQRKSKLLKELAIVWCLMKPAVDTHRVVNKAEQKDALVVPQTELTGSRTCEMLFESVPSTVIQLLAIFAGNTSTIAVFSLLVSISTSAFISAQMSYEWDTSEQERKNNPRFFGYIPMNGVAKVKIAALLFLTSTFNLVIRALSCVIFVQNGIGIAVFCAELLLYFFVKLARGDFLYWLPVYGAAGVIVAALERCVVKLTVDWILLIQFRHPKEVGGVYWFFSLCLTIIMGVASALAYKENENEENTLEEGFVRTAMAGCCTGLILSFDAFLISIKREYVWTFFDTNTSCTSIQETFLKSDDDAAKFNIFNNSEVKWRWQIGDDVKDWFKERMNVWMEEVSEEGDVFYNDFRKSKVPKWVLDED
ncbi:hypothetical protein TrVE_jg9728 [Triparma verrucosa]|uniref:Uncharacterized protein n=1 Tax=Triparma verrucosa TaxID=1606542 RepID=A0A9W7C4A4_9STRA|nr:hypothetical protein TrVE_jg9728 [Triparma verrucosa]